MSLLDVLNRPWAITREKHEELFSVYERHMSGVRFDPAEIRAALGDPRLSNQAGNSYTVQDGVAIIPIQGVMAKKMNLLTALCGGISTEMAVQQVQQASHVIVLEA